MNNLGVLALCPWLSPKDVKESRDFVPVIDKEQKEFDVKYFDSLKQETDVCFPVSEQTGHRTSDVQLLMSTNDVRLQNVIAGSLRSQGSATGYTGSDADIAQQVIPRGMSMGDVSDFINSTADVKDALDAEPTPEFTPDSTPESVPDSTPESVKV